MGQNIPHAVSETRTDLADDFWRGALAGLIPLILVVVVLALTVACVTLARVLSTPLGFLTWEWIVSAIWDGGLIVAAIVYALATVRALRRAASWQDTGLRKLASGAYWALAVAALLVLLPVLLALPQHPSR